MKKGRFKKALVSLLLSGVLICGMAVPASAQPADETEESGIFSGRDVTLNPGMFKDSQETGEEFLLTYDVDRLAVSLFRYSSKRADAPIDMNNGYGGWEDSGENGIGGHSYGHYMSACVAMYNQTRNEQLKKNVERAVELLGIAQDDDGFVAGFSRVNLDYVFDHPNDFWAGGNNDAFLQGIWAPWYTIHKLLAGLIDAYQYMGIEDALVYAERLAAYAKNGTDKLNDEQMEKMLVGEHGGINESFAQLYEITGNEDYLNLAKRFSHKAVMDPLSRGENILPGLHANTQIPKMCGAAKIYLLTGDEYYKKAAENFWKFVVETQTYANGGTSNYEFFTDVDEEPLSDKNCETCCVYNMLKLTEYIFQWDQSSKYTDYYENVLYNQILGSQNSEGYKTYSVDLSMGASTVFLSHDNFECCLGTGMENPGRYHRMIYYKTADDLYVNLFINSTVNWNEKGMTVTLQTDYPEKDTVKLTVDKAESTEAALRIRVPQWTEEMTVSVNGEETEAPAVNGYAVIERVWNQGDVVDIKVPMQLELYTARGDDHLVAFKYGAILLAGDLGSDRVRSVVAPTRDPEDFIQKTGDGLEFVIDQALQPGDRSITLKPFYEFESEPHMVYWNLYTTEEYEQQPSLNSSLEERLYDVTIDSVVPGHMQSEVDHNYQNEGGTFSGIFTPAAQPPATGSWRSANGGWISYDLKVDPDNRNYLLSMFWGSDNLSTDNRQFDILVNDVVLQKDYILNNNRPDKIEYFYLEIPESLTSGEDTVTVKYRSDAGNTAGGVFGVRTTTKPVDEIVWDTVIKSSDPAVEKRGSWNDRTADGAYENSDIWTGEPGAEAEYSFSGNSYIRLSARTDSSQDGADIYLDGEKVRTVYTGQGTDGYRIAWESSWLDPDTQHTLKIVSTGNFAFDYIQLGNEPVKIGNEGQTPVFEDIAVTSPGRTIYQIGDKLDLTGLKVEAVYSDGSTIDITERAEITGFDSETAGEKTITVSYRGAEKTFTVNVAEPEKPEEPVLTELRVREPDKMEYQIGDKLDLTGMKVVAVYSDGNAEDVTDEAEVAGFDSETAGEKNVTVSYKGLEKTFTVTVAGKDPAEPGIPEKPDDNNPGISEKPDDNNPEKPDSPSEDTEQNKSPENTGKDSAGQMTAGENQIAVQTGDTSVPFLYMGLMSVTVFAAAVVVLRKIRAAK